MAGVRARDHDDKRQMILERTAQLFARQGFHGTSTAEIAAACTASKSWIYHYFDSKEAVLYALLDEFMEMYVGRIAGAVSAARTPADRLRAYMREALAVLIAYRINYARLFSDVDALPPKQQRSVRDRERAISESLRDILVELRPELKRHETLLMPITLLSMGSLVWSHTWFDPKGPVSLDRLVDLATALLISGLDGALAVAETRD